MTESTQANHHHPRSVQGRRRAGEGVPAGAAARAHRRGHREGSAAARHRSRQPLSGAVFGGHADAIRNWAMGVGDDNPLYLDEDYGPGDPVGHPDRPRHADGPHQDADARGPDAGRDQAPDQVDVPWGPRVRLGRHVGVVPAVASGRPRLQLQRRGEPRRQAVGVRRPFGRSRSAATCAINQFGEVLGVYRILRVLTERKESRSKGKYAGDRAGALHGRGLRAHRRDLRSRGAAGAPRSATGRTSRSATSSTRWSRARRP